MNRYELICGLLWGLCAMGLTWYVATIARQISYVTLADGRRQERTLPLIFRLLLPLAPNVERLWTAALFLKSRTEASRRLTAAGFDGLLSASEFLSLRLLQPLVLGPFWVLFVMAALKSPSAGFLRPFGGLLILLGPVWFFLYPTLWLKRAVETRHRRIRRSLPFVMDLLTLSVEAGMDFMTALQRNVERGPIDPLGEELIRVIREIQLGKTRRHALRDLAHRVDLPDLRSVVNALVQADEMGVGIGAILRIQADQIRQRRFERAEKLANEAPVKMLFPLMFFIFPAVFLILLGPVLAQLMRQGL